MTVSDDRHLESTVLGAYLDDATSPAERREVEKHLADCASCRGELVELSRLLKTESRPRIGRAIGVGLAAAAAVVAVLVLRPGDVEVGSDPMLRGQGAGLADSVSRVAVVSPRPGAEVAIDSFRFAWRGMEPGASYRFTLTDELGDVVWQETTADTTMAVPPRAGLGAGVEYYWYVDALLSDGRSATSGVHRFRTPP